MGEQHLALINVNGSTVKDVPAKDFIRSFAEHLKRKNLVKMPEWAQYVKTAAWKELAPYESDWLYTRCASVMYQLYIRRKIGGMGMRKHYGGGARNGTCKKHVRIASGKQLTTKGMQDMDRIAYQISKSSRATRSAA